ncbi:SGNH/GDSL hydrolase family protein [Saccharothrix lopnurensis]|uniref:SGNH/GDSL hydrolase family protein n=1 Tax=Saccharothrix lopnurensis TaxID=1670621 RepID=A0ABW1NXI0_9PSEU
MRLRERWAAGAAVLLSCLLVAPTGQAAEPLEYVALGDSAAAGPLVPVQDVNLLCLRSERNYPAVAARALRARLVDVTCSGATTDDLAGRRFGFLPPQFTALGPDTDLVSITIGANDVGMFQAALGCVNLLPDPYGRSCADHGPDLRGAVTAWEAEFGTALAEIRRRAPRARVLVTGYATYIRPGGCFPTQPVWARDADHLQGLLDAINAAARDQARRHGAAFVDLAAVSVGHDICAAPAARYLEGLIPTRPAAPLHPNAAGMAAFGEAVAAAARR